MQKLIIKNFRQISNAEIEITDFLCLMGEQASGKSTIVKLIYFFKSLRQDIADVVSRDFDRSIDKISKFLITHIQNKFCEYFGYTSNLNQDVLVRYYYSEKENRYVELTKNKSLTISFEPNFWKFLLHEVSSLQVTLKKNNKTTGAVPNYVVLERIRRLNNKSIVSFGKRVFDDSRDCVFFPAGRSITVSYPEQFQLLFFRELNSPVNRVQEKNTIDINLMKQFVSYSKYLIDYFSGDNFDKESKNNSLQVVQDYSKKILHADYRNDNGRERLFYEKDFFTPLNIASSGQQECIRIIQDILYIVNEKLSVNRIIEEIETHLFPTAQQALTMMIVFAANITKSQIIITTHSPHVQATFNNLLYLSKVINKHPEEKKELLRHFGINSDSDSISVKPEQFQAYSLVVGEGKEYCTSTKDMESNLIGNNLLDEASEEIYNDFDYLYQKLYND